MAQTSGSGTLHILRIERDLINDTGLYEVSYAQEGMQQQELRIRQFLGEDPLMTFLERDVKIEAERARHLIDQLRNGDRVQVPVSWSGDDLKRYGLGDPRKAA